MSYFVDDPKPTEWTLCPTATCNATAVVTDEFDLDSTDGPVAHVETTCVMGHSFITSREDLDLSPW